MRHLIPLNMKNVSVLFSLSLLLSFVGCTNQQEYAELAMVADDAVQDMAPSPENTEIHIDRKVIKEGEIRFETSSIEDTKQSISQAVQDINGYISKDDVYSSNNEIENRLVVRIPYNEFDEFLNRITKDISKLDSKTINVLDVTEEYIDISARLQTKKDIEARYKELLKQARNVEEILAIEKEIGKLREEIESVEGRLRYLKDRIGFSTITLTPTP